jgi:hypothetical protein
MRVHAAAALPLLALIKKTLFMLTTGLFLFPTAGHCAAKRRQHSWPLVYIDIIKMNWNLLSLRDNLDK